MARLSFRCDQDLVDRVDRERGMVPRETWLRAAIEGSLGGFDANREWKRVPPAAGPTRSQQSKRDVRPIPKGKG